MADGNLDFLLALHHDVRAVIPDNIRAIVILVAVDTFCFLERRRTPTPHRRELLEPFVGFVVIIKAINGFGNGIL